MLRIRFIIIFVFSIRRKERKCLERRGSQKWVPFLEQLDIKNECAINTHLANATPAT